MSLELSGTTGVKGVAGSVAAPSIVGDDTNTGISFPAADTIKFSTGGVERMQITNSGVTGTGISAGKILQVVHVTKTDITSITTGSSSAYYDISGLTATITPSSTSNKILIDALLSISINNGYHITARILRGSTNIAFGDNGSQNNVIEGYAHRYTRATNGSYTIDQMTLFHEDSPSTTSATTYKIQFNTHTAGTAYINRTHVGQDAIYNGTAVSSIRLMEVAA